MQHLYSCLGVSLFPLVMLKQSHTQRRRIPWLPPGSHHSVLVPAHCGLRRGSELGDSLGTRGRLGLKFCAFCWGGTPPLLLSWTHPVLLGTQLRCHPLWKPSLTAFVRNPKHFFPVISDLEAAGGETEVWSISIWVQIPTLYNFRQVGSQCPTVDICEMG